MRTSHVSSGPVVTFPEWCGDKHYMLPFTLKSGLPKVASKFHHAVDQMMSGIQVDRNQECYFMVDEKEVSLNQTHRRSGLHVDGYWIPPAQCHAPPGKHSPTPPKHSPTPGKHSVTPTHSAASEHNVEAILLASNYTAARALVGEYERDFLSDWRGGDCSELDTSGLEEVILHSGISYNMDVFTLHESLPVKEMVRRTVIRINVPRGNF